jgi:biotin synthase-like enzyme
MKIKLQRYDLNLIIEGLECRELWGSGYYLADKFTEILNFIGDENDDYEMEVCCNMGIDDSASANL